MRRGCLRFSVGLALFGLACCAAPAPAQSTPSRLPPVADGLLPVDLQPAPGTESPSDEVWAQTLGASPGLTDLRPFGSQAGAAARPQYSLGGCDGNANRAIIGLVGYDSWRGVADDSWQNNGIHTGFNYGTRLGQLSELTGFGAQIGGTVGIYDWSGSEYRPTSQQGFATTQGFLTYGLFHKPTDTSRWNAGLVQDWMAVNNYGSFGQNVTMSQLRMLLGYAVSDRDEFGAWGTARVYDQTRNVTAFGIGPTTYRPIDQVSFYWHHKWSPGGADTWLSAGAPEADRLAGGGSLGSWLVSAVANVPLSDRVSLYNSVTYMHPSASPSATAAVEDAWNFSIGLAFYSGRTARSSTVAGQCWLPQMPVANNGTFLVDASNH